MSRGIKENIPILNGAIVSGKEYKHHTMSNPN
jgi:hypothetical protein